MTVATADEASPTYVLCGACATGVESETSNQRLNRVRKEKAGASAGERAKRREPRHLGLQIEWAAHMQKLNRWLSGVRGVYSGDERGGRVRGKREGMNDWAE
jgi:hypothetical protein